jgi:hypothetical protein
MAQMEFNHDRCVSKRQTGFINSDGKKASNNSIGRVSDEDFGGV